MVCLFVPFGMATGRRRPAAWLAGIAVYFVKIAIGAVLLGDGK